MNDRAYKIEPRNRFYAANRSIVEHEIRPGNTVIFLHQVDLTEIEQIRAAAGELRPSYTAFVAKGVALALKDFPYANRRIWTLPWIPFFGTRLQKFERYDIAVACERNVPGADVATFADILRDADSKPLYDMTLWLRQLANSDAESNAQWRSYSQIITRFPAWISKRLIRLPLMIPSMYCRYRGGAVLISSPAKYGVDIVATTWSWPLGVSFGVVKDRPVVKNGQVVACPTFVLTLNFDRRVMAGAQAAKFCKRFIDTLENAQSEMRDWIPPSHS